MSEPFQKLVSLKLKDGVDIHCNVQLASVPKVGPGPAPQGPVAWVVRQVGDSVLTIDVSFLDATPKAASIVGIHAIPHKPPPPGGDMQEEQLLVPFGQDQTVFCRFSIAATVVTGPGPRPNGPVALVHCIDSERFLVIETRVGPAHMASIKTGPGSPP